MYVIMRGMKDKKNNGTEKTEEHALSTSVESDGLAIASETEIVFDDGENVLADAPVHEHAYSADDPADDKMGGGYASVKGTRVRGGNFTLWLVVIVMTVMCAVIGVCSSLLTAHFMKRGSLPPTIDSTDVKQSVAAVVAARKPSVVEITCGDKRGSGIVTKLENNKIYVLTNAHVVEGRDSSLVRFYGEDGYYSASTVGYSSFYDVAVICVSGHTPKYEIFDLDGSEFFDRSVKYSEGDFVVAIGNAMSMGIAAYDGIISKSHNLLKYEDKTVPVLRTTAAINAGMSGGGLFDMNGRLIGLGTYRMTSSVEGSDSHKNDVEDTGFAVPVSIVYPLYKQILETDEGGEEYRIPTLTFAQTSSSVGCITVALRDFGTFTAEYRDGRLTVTSLDSVDAPRSLFVGDVIESIGGVAVTDDICIACGELLRYRFNSPRGSTLKLGIARADSSLEINVTGYKCYVA